MADPISDMLIRIQNGYRAKKEAVVLPYSKLKERIAHILEDKRYIAGVGKKGRKVRKFLEIKLRYEGTAPAITGIKRISKPSRRIYMGRGDLKPVRQGFGTLIISTPKGVMSGEEAKKQGLGGEAIAEVW